MRSLFPKPIEQLLFEPPPEEPKAESKTDNVVILRTPTAEQAAAKAAELGFDVRAIVVKRDCHNIYNAHFWGVVMSLRRHEVDGAARPIGVQFFNSMYGSMQWFLPHELFLIHKSLTIKEVTDICVA